MSEVNWFFKRIEYRLKVFRTLWNSDLAYKTKRFHQDFKRDINLIDPQTLNEKIIFRMLFEYRHEFTTLADKVSAREFLSTELGEEYLVPIIGVYDYFDEIDFDRFPGKFVLKCSHDSGSSIVCLDKQLFDKESARKKINFCLSRNYYYIAREKHYRDITPRIICEEYVDVFCGRDRDITPELFRMHCFSGNPHYIEVDFTDSNGQEFVNIYDTDWVLQDVSVGYPNNHHPNIIEPDNLIEVLKLSSVLSRTFDYCRVDWFITDKRAYFSEFTFTPCAGRVRFDPISFDYHLGSIWK